MQFVETNAQLITCNNPVTLVELVGRTCYKSEDKITEDSARGFVERLAKSHHFAMLEHGWVDFEITGIDNLPPELEHIPWGVYTKKYVVESDLKQKAYHYLTLSLSHLYQFAEGRDYDLDAFGKHLMEGMWNCFFDKFLNPIGGQLECTSCGVSIKLLDSIADMKMLTVADFTKHKHYSFRFTCDRGVSHELVRHRMAMGQESTRYVAYDKEKFGAQVVFIPPADWEDWTDEEKEVFESGCKQSEIHYMKLRNMGKTPQQARAMLNNALKTEVCMTGSIDQLTHFFDVRSIGVTGAPHPDMKKVADIAIAQFEDQKNKDLEIFW